MPRNRPEDFPGTATITDVDMDAGTVTIRTDNGTVQAARTGTRFVVDEPIDYFIPEPEMVFHPGDRIVYAGAHEGTVVPLPEGYRQYPRETWIDIGHGPEPVGTRFLKLKYRPKKIKRNLPDWF